MAESNSRSGQIKQVSRPWYNDQTGYWHNRVRTIEPDGADGYRVVNEEVHQSKDFKSLPAPWHENVDAYLASKLDKIGFAILSMRRGGGARSLGEKLDPFRGPLLAIKEYLDARSEVDQAYRKGGNPLSGTLFDQPYHPWPGTDKPWDWSTVHPYGRDPSPRPNPDGFAPRDPEPERRGEFGDARTLASAEPSEPASGRAEQGVTSAPALASAGLPPQVIANASYLRANGYEITPRTMYVTHVLGPERAVDLFRRTGSTGSPPEVPSPDAATGDQMRAWAQALRGYRPAAPAGIVAATPANGAADAGDGANVLRQ